MVDEQIAVRDARDELGRFGPGNNAAVLRAGKRNRVSDTMRSAAVRAISEAGADGNPLLILWNLARDSKNERVRAWCARECCRQLWGDKLTFDAADGSEIDEDTVRRTRVMLAAVFQTETRRE